MSNMFKFYGSKLTPKEYLSVASTEDVSFYFSEAGEDATVIKLFNKKRNGFYIDVGAFRPRKYSNTYLLHRFFGWSGINVDASSEAIDLFKEERPGDININAAVGESAGEATFYKFKEKTINTISEENLKRQLNRGKEIVGEEKVQVISLKDIFFTHVEKGKTIDLLNVDIEGQDLQALKSNDWSLYRPLMILVEDYSLQSVGIEKSEIYNYLRSVGYKLTSHTFQTSIYVVEDFHKLIKDLHSTEFGVLEGDEGIYALTERSLTVAKAHPEWKQLKNKLAGVRKNYEESKERQKILNDEINLLKGEKDSLKDEIRKYQSQIRQYQFDMMDEKEKYETLVAEYRQLEKRYNNILSSRTWRYLNPVRTVVDTIKTGIGLKRKKRNSLKKGNSAVKKKQIKATTLDKKLWGGFSTYAKEELEQIMLSEKKTNRERIKASWALMRWEFANEKYDNALANLELINKLDPSKVNDIERIVMKVKCFMKLKRIDDAKALLEEAIEIHGYNPDLCLAVANTKDTEEEKLKWVNYVFENSGYLPIIKKNNQEPLSLSNITADNSILENSSVEFEQSQKEKVSIIIPAYSAEDMIGVTLDSLLNQTWKNIEIIVVDDCSPDNTCEVISSYAAKDNRVKLIRKEKNEGAYSARNTALDYITGDYVTVHDSDDWSHPQKIESQIRALLNKPEYVAVVSYWARVYDDMTFVGPWFPKGTYFERNLSSLLFPREVIEKMGGWDVVRVTGDTEFFWRIETVYGKGSVLVHRPTLPLSFSLSSDTSLTRSKATHIRTVKFGLRRVYRDAAQWWHTNYSTNEPLFVNTKSRERTFPAPVMNYFKRPEVREYDIVYVSDFSAEDDYFSTTIDYIVAAVQAGKKVGVFHWDRYDDYRDDPINPRFYQVAQDNDIEILVPGESVSAEFLIVGNPMILKHQIDSVPEVKSNNVLVLIGSIEHKETFSPEVAREHLEAAFHSKGKWISLSPLVQKYLKEDERYLFVSDEIWSPFLLLSNDVGSRSFQGGSGKKAVIGRHGQDDNLAWSSIATTIQSVYGMSNEYDVHIYGSAERPINLLGEKPENWTISSDDQVAETDFLSNIDFYVYYPSKQYNYDFGRPILKAMASGLPVILPPEFEIHFGNAATYANPDDVVKVVREIWGSEQLYMAKVSAAKRFVANHCSISSFKERLEEIRKNHVNEA
ncbi:glycosyltransferase [Alkalihalobacterium bogoriense]|uniref:glycosyltransferase n=1 Tax=Alkalihalobacterium bogoriense TaxID=246272 RepID=UPI00047DDE18|nr:glycosyltransferase [Alkalihalobacterium bogoriense]